MEGRDVRAAAGVPLAGLIEGSVRLALKVVEVVVWVLTHPLLVAAGAAAAAAAGELIVRRLAGRASRKRMRLRLIPSPSFDPDLEMLWRSATAWSSAAASGPWWAPRRSKSLRVLLRADGTRPLDYYVEAPVTARHLLTVPALRGVRVEDVERTRVKRNRFTVRAEFMLRGADGARLREVPLEPDPLQPLVDAVATLRSDLGENVEVALDMQPIPRWQIRLRRWQRISDARAKSRAQARSDARHAAVGARDVEDTFRYQLAALLGDQQRRPSRLNVPVRPRPVNTEQALGKLGEKTGLVRVQLLVRCGADKAGKAEQRLQTVSAALKSFAGEARLSPRGRRVGPWEWGPDRWPLRKGFERRFATGQIAPGSAGWVHLSEVTGLLKPPTVHCKLPVLASDVPSYRVGAPGLMPQGWMYTADGRRRLIASPISESLFSVRVGKSTYGKTTQAVVQFTGLAHGQSYGGLFVDPHGDAFAEAAPYLAHNNIMARLQYVDLTGTDPEAKLGSWNPLGLERGQDPAQVVWACVDAFASVLGWSDVTHPRALTLLTKSLEVLVGVNARAVAEGRPERQCTLFQLGPLLTDAAWRQRALARIHAGLQVRDSEMLQWWRTVFPTIPAEGYSTILNPVERLRSSGPVQAFLGQPISTYCIREAMDQRQLVWLCPSASGPTDRLVLNLLLRDLYRAGISRRDTPAAERVDFHVFVDELISVDGGTSTLAQISEELRKFGGRLHGMTQLLPRLSTATRESLLQNASIISTTAASADSAALITREWDGAVTPAEITALDRFDHFLTLTSDGRRIGPLFIRGPQLSEVFSGQYRPDKVSALRAAAATNLRARPVPEGVRAAAAHTRVVAEFLGTLPGKELTPSTPEYEAGRDGGAGGAGGDPGGSEGASGGGEGGDGEGPVRPELA